MKYLDLSHTLSEKTPVYPGDPHVKLDLVNSHDSSGFEDHSVTLGNHVGTHIDAPSHMIKGAKRLADFPIENFVGEGGCIDVSSGFDLGTIKKADLKERVLFYTGMGEKFSGPGYFEDFPPIPRELAEYLVAKNLKMVGVDTCSVDKGEPYEIHKILLGADILLVENLTNLKGLVGKTFKLTALPLKLEIDGAPARVVAEIQG